VRPAQRRSRAFEADFFQAAEQERSCAEVVFDVGEGAFAAMLAGGVFLLRFGGGHAWGVGCEAVIVFIAIDLAMIGFRLLIKALRAEGTVGTRAGGRSVDPAVDGAGLGVLFRRGAEL